MLGREAGDARVKTCWQPDFLCGSLRDDRLRCLREELSPSGQSTYKASSKSGREWSRSSKYNVSSTGLIVEVKLADGNGLLVESVNLARTWSKRGDETATIQSVLSVSRVAYVDLHACRKSLRK